MQTDAQGHPMFMTALDRIKKRLVENVPDMGVWLQGTVIKQDLAREAIVELEARIDMGQDLNPLEQLALAVMAQTAGVNP